ncbi:hypothetical protein SYNTR_1940 [Candidatus Syntrophocurvum alkaliphilum]|uniref:Uncharacterized protein n=1 Tax=Candidatus Syntrophocurvum alkaliphilum TaxID=2293317 RepID=A0A6I6DHY8_9FIRM|nr:hypothetical protein [Candidatus Syntrophocurvum alkaliphilum]QGU00534.1 hypothetical protein SYNTR_1940 [Candidatus Syntrophocurvum alkaliphilum]
MIWLLLGLFLVIILVEVPALIIEKLYRELFVFCVIFAVGVYMSLVQLYGLPFFDLFNYIITMLPDI